MAGENVGVDCQQQVSKLHAFQKVINTDCIASCSALQLFIKMNRNSSSINRIILTLIYSLILLHTTIPGHCQEYQGSQGILAKLKPYVLKYRTCAFPFVSNLARKTSKSAEEIEQETYVKCARQRKNLADAMINTGFLHDGDVNLVESENAQYIASWIAKARENK